MAREAGVSKGTVSRALNGGRWVSPESQRAVDAAVKKTGYRANAYARGLKLQRAGSVAFLLGEDLDRMFSDPNFAVLMRGASESLAERNMAMVLLLAGAAEERKRALDFIGAGQIDGVMLVSWHEDLGVLEDLHRAGIPTIFCGVPQSDRGAVSYVSADDYEGAMQMTEHLLSRGRSRIAMIAGPRHGVTGSLRVDGFRAVLGDRADPNLIVHGDYSRESGAEAMRELLARDPHIDGVFAANDLMAAGAIAAAQRVGRRVPLDISIGGFDDSSAAVASDPQITTMRQPFQRISNEMTRLLMESIAGAPAAHLSLRTELVVRDST
ncbi:LacI family DNA-binding transcriptional regulator [Herbiconiux sp. KACC 21604]|uniref:LacI family DNA-binding transcriptional regulator n=1 Tax=Herbiconiux sp. KACC 21604 TaxID=3092664 RepID=UPI0038905CAE|nr:LacI family DNA-binding transcriptional regulator [Herbiconiux sp. KACC 21604]